jgi:protein transport protein HofQ
MAWMRLIVLLIAWPLAALADKGVSLVLDNAPVVQVLQALAEQQNVNLLIAPGVEGVVSLHLQNILPKQAFQLVLKAARLAQIQEGNVVQIVSRAQQQEQQALLEERRMQQALKLPLRSQAFSLVHADASELADSLKSTGEKLLSARGNVTVDKRTNRLIVRDSNLALKQVAAWMAEMDFPMGQVEIAAHIVTINKNKLHELGVKWSLPQGDNAGGTGRVSLLGADIAANNASAHVGFNIARIDGRLLEIALSALEQQQQLEIIASPRLMAAHQQPASIKQGTEIPYQVSNGEGGGTSVEFKEAVLGMEVTPIILPRGIIRLKLRISQNMPGRSIQQGEGEALAIDKQEIETIVSVKDGQTLALGGIFQQHNKESRDSVPLLSNIPLFGGLFRHDAKDAQRRELVVFITPRLIPIP